MFSFLKLPVLIRKLNCCNLHLFEHSKNAINLHSTSTVTVIIFATVTFSATFTDPVTVSVPITWTSVRDLCDCFRWGSCDSCFCWFGTDTVTVTVKVTMSVTVTWSCVRINNRASTRATKTATDFSPYHNSFNFFCSRDCKMNCINIIHATVSETEWEFDMGVYSDANAENEEDI